MMTSKFKFIVYYDISYTSPFLVKIGSLVMCFHLGNGYSIGLVFWWDSSTQLKKGRQNRPFDILFLVCGELFLPTTKTKTPMALLVISSLKSLENHLLCSKDFSQTVGNISKAF
jgi:hypothetical protein